MHVNVFIILIYVILSVVFVSFSINEVYASLYEFIQSNDTWERSCETFQLTLDSLNGTNNVTTPELPGEYLCIMCVCVCVCLCLCLCLCMMYVCL